MDILATLNSSIGLAMRLRDLAKNAAEAEFKAVLTDLIVKLSDAQLEAATQRARIAELEAEIALLKRVAPAGDEEPSGTLWGCYLFGDDKTRLYCTGCWDKGRRKALTNRVNSNSRRCGACQSLIGT